MKKCFLAVITALSLAGFSYAQDDEYEEEEVVYEEEAPAAPAAKPAPKKQAVVYEEVEEEDEAPVQKPKKASKPRPAGMPFVGIGIDVGGMLNQNANINVTFKLNESMELTAILGLWSRGETTAKDKNTGIEADLGDDAMQLAFGAGFDYYLNAGALLPFSVGGELIFNSPMTESSDDDALQMQINVLAGAHAELIKNLNLTGKVGLGINYDSFENNSVEKSRIDFGLVTKVYLTWFVF